MTGCRQCKLRLNTVVWLHVGPHPRYSTPKHEDPERTQVSAWNFFRYNVVGGGDSALYGVEGPLFYLRNGVLNLNLALPLALALPALMAARALLRLLTREFLGAACCCFGAAKHSCTGSARRKGPWIAGQRNRRSIAAQSSILS